MSQDCTPHLFPNDGHQDSKEMKFRDFPAMFVWIPGRFIIRCVTTLSHVPEHLEIEDSRKVPFGSMKGLGSDKIFEVDKNCSGKKY